MQMNYTRLLAGLFFCLAGGQLAAQSVPAIVVIGETQPDSFSTLSEKPRLVALDAIGEVLATGDAKAVYLQDAPDNKDALAGILTGLPYGQKLVVTINSCGWDQVFDAEILAASLGDSTGIVIATPEKPESCEADALAKSFAVAAEQDDLTESLKENGYVLHGAGLVSEVVLTPLVITALPVASLDDETTPKLVALQSSTVPISQSPSSVALNSGPATRNSNGPEPSIIVGDLAVLMVAGARGPLGMPYQAREEIRQRDPAMYARLLTQGAFDPDEGQVASAVQTELARMNCYGGSIDGAWGAGSIAALRRYYDAAEISQNDTSPEVSLYRAVLMNNTVQCPAVQTAAPVSTPRRQPAQAQSSRGGGQNARPANTARPQAQRPAAAQPTQSTQPKFNPSMMGSGVFR